MLTGMGRTPPTLGQLIRRQRELHELSLRQMARAAGISNPYLSQIERGLREPSEQVLEAIARSLELSVDALYEQAGLTRSDEHEEEPAVIRAIQDDRGLSARQRRALIEIYEAFIAENGGTVSRSARARPRRTPSRRRE
jgi:transcriptional regulator with XRE-family HTH domain